MITVTDTSTAPPSKLGSAIVAGDVFGQGTRRFLAVDISLGAPAANIVAVDDTTFVATPIVPDQLYNVYEGFLAIANTSA